MSLTSLFVGAPQSKYAALAILAAVLVVSVTLLFGKDPIPFTQKLAFVLLLFLISLPGVLMTLFQMTCLVTGAGFKNQRWWCAAYAWVVTILLILYCVMLIGVAVVSLTTGEKLLAEIAAAEVETFEDAMAKADKTAKQYFVGDAVVEDPELSTVKEDAKKTNPEVEPETALAKPAAAKEAPMDTFKVAGGASAPADVPAPEGFDDKAVEMFSSCPATYDRA